MHEPRGPPLEVVQLFYYHCTLNKNKVFRGLDREGGRVCLAVIPRGARAEGESVLPTGPPNLIASLATRGLRHRARERTPKEYHLGTRQTVHGRVTGFSPLK